MVQLLAYDDISRVGAVLLAKRTHWRSMTARSEVFFYTITFWEY